ncbi:hypothetical protein [Cryobacterium arcticum]|uniref:Uncharacterized protein n=1 Tax=Cryobacterium arcticum TaxID=670052 RepID=A0A317ZSA1_9MICO|nr:hypothetical protein [Cryobacterium arcticum]PXA70060.1 hypothetical protein CTB96_08695 [Cryobacterium arcticum]
MIDQPSGDSPQSGTDAAARLLQVGDALNDRVHAAIDARTRAIAESCMAAAVLAYVFAVVLSGGGNAGLGAGANGYEPNGLGFAFLILVPFLAATSLEQGLRQSLHTAGHGRSRTRRVLVASASMLPLCVALILVVFWQTPWPLALLITVVTTVPLLLLATQSARRARNWGVRRPKPVWLAPLGGASQISTAVLGLWLGAIAALSGTTLILAGGLTVIAFFCTVMVTQQSRWGLPRLAGEWGREQWSAFGCSYLLMLGLAVVLSRTNWDLTVVGIVGGVCVAAPLVIAAFRPAPIWEP